MSSFLEDIDIAVSIGRWQWSLAVRINVVTIYKVSPVIGDIVVQRDGFGWIPDSEAPILETHLRRRQEALASLVSSHRRDSLG